MTMMFIPASTVTEGWLLVNTKPASACRAPPATIPSNATATATRLITFCIGIISYRPTTAGQRESSDVDIRATF
jgi:hypothetical protein